MRTMWAGKARRYIIASMGHDAYDAGGETPPVHPWGTMRRGAGTAPLRLSAPVSVWRQPVAEADSNLAGLLNQLMVLGYFPH